MYKTGKDASDYWKEIVRAAQINVLAVYSSIGVYEIERVNPVLAKYIDLALKDVINHVIFEVYYIIYLLCTEHNSLTYYYKMFFLNQIQIHSQRPI